MKRIFLMVLIILPVLATNGTAQTYLRKWDFGGQVTRIRQSSLYNMDDYGFGLRLTYNAARYLGVESEISYYPKESQLKDESDIISNRRLEGLFGLKGGLRLNRFGLYGKIRPGFVQYGKSRIPRICIPEDPCPDKVIENGTSFALDVGAVFEFYPFRRTILRFDFSNLIIRHPPSNEHIDWYNDYHGIDDFSINNFRVGIGIGFNIGDRSY